MGEIKGRRCHWGYCRSNMGVDREGEACSELGQTEVLLARLGQVNEVVDKSNTALVNWERAYF